MEVVATCICVRAGEALGDRTCVEVLYGNGVDIAIVACSSR